MLSAWGTYFPCSCAGSLANNLVLAAANWEQPDDAAPPSSVLSALTSGLWQPLSVRAFVQCTRVLCVYASLGEGHASARPSDAVLFGSRPIREGDRTCTSREQYLLTWNCLANWGTCCYLQNDKLSSCLYVNGNM